MNTLDDYHQKTFVNVLTKTHKKVTEQLDKLKQIRSLKVKTPGSIETKCSKCLRQLVWNQMHTMVEASMVWTKKVMNNGTYVFDELALIFKDRKRPDCLLLDNNMDALCLHFREVFVLWDGTFSLARMKNPDDIVISTYQIYVMAAVQGHTNLNCPITPKVHLMLKHVEWQLKKIRDGLGDKMEDRIECMHQDGIHERQQFHTVSILSGAWTLSCYSSCFLISL